MAEQRLLGEAFAIHMHDLIGDLDDPAAAFDELLDAHDDRFARALICSFDAASAVAVGSPARAGRASRDGLAADPDVVFSFWGSMNEMWAAIAQLAEGGDVDGAIALFEHGHGRFLQAGTRTGLGLYYSSMAIELSAAGRLDAATAYLDLAQLELATYGERWPEPLIVLAEAELTAARGGAPVEIRALLDRAEQLARQQGSGAVARRIAASAARLLARPAVP